MIKLTRLLLICTSTTLLLSACESLPFKKTDHSADNLPNHQPPVPETPAAAPAIEHYSTVWERMRKGYGLPNTSNVLIDTQLKFFTTNKAYFYKITEQSEPYLYYVVNEMQANDIPLELALLPFIESAYNPSATSVGNSGMWQIAAGTGKVFGLTQNRWYDGRKDVVDSTAVAIRLLKKLNKTFDGDWLLTIAAYNGGEGTIQQAINKNQRMGKPTDFWSLPLNKTIQGYIPQLLALSKIVADPERYSYKLYPVADQPYFVKVNVNSHLNVSEAVQNANIDATKFKKLNAGMSTWLTDPTGPHPILVAVEDAAAFTLHLDNLPKLPATQWQEHTVRKGDTLETIAKTYNISANDIKKINNLTSNNLSIGQRLQLSLNSTALNSTTPNLTSSNTQNKNTTAIQSKPQEKDKSYYTVKSGENLWTIAKSQNITVAYLAQINNINTKAQLKPGQKLIVKPE